MFKINLIKVVLFIILAFFSTSCDNSSTGAEEHVDADGFSMELNDVEVYRELEGEIITNTINLSINDTLDLSVHFLDHEGNEIHHHDEEDEESEEELTFNIQDYNIINIISNCHHDVHCDEFSTEEDCGTSDECEWHADDNACEDADHDHDDDVHCDEFSTEEDCGTSNECEWHADDNACEDSAHNDDDHEFGLLLIGTSTGTTTFTMSLMHDGHADYTSLPISVTVD